MNQTDEWHDEKSDDRVWLIITRQCGYIEFYTLPDCELRFKDRNFSNAPRLIEQSRFEGSAGDRRQDVPVIQEINLFPLGPRQDNGMNFLFLAFLHPKFTRQTSKL